MPKQNQRPPQERAADAAAELRELIAQAHGAAKDLETARKAAQAVYDAIPARVEQLLSHTVNAELEEFREAINNTCMNWQRGLSEQHFKFAEQFLNTERMPAWLEQLVVTMTRNLTKKLAVEMTSKFTIEFRKLIKLKNPANDAELLSLMTQSLLAMNEGSDIANLMDGIGFFRIAPTKR